MFNNIKHAVNHILVGEQHGFIPGISTTTCILVLYFYIHETFLIHSPVDVIYMDFAKSFDHVDHFNLIKVPDSVGFGDLLLPWLRHYMV